MKQQTQNNLFIILERLWLIGAVAGIVLTVAFLIMKDNDSALFFFAFFILSSVIYLVRKSQRKKQEAYLNDKNNGSQRKG